ncbi:unnamed protein product [Discosporangium mesarthrocarpum]
MKQGLDPRVVDVLLDHEDPLGSSLRRVIYVSCGFDAFKGDATQLTSGGWSLTHTEGFVLFPGSDHVETLAIFDR